MRWKCILVAISLRALSNASASWWRAAECAARMAVVVGDDQSEALERSFPRWLWWGQRGTAVSKVSAGRA